MVEFANTDDRDYYTFKEPAHLEYIESLKPIVEQVVVVDFSNDEF